MLRNSNGLSQAVIESGEFLQLLLPTLRADITVCETYVYNHDPLLNCPIAVFGGKSDPCTSSKHLAAWQQHTQASCTLKMLPGDHFFIRTAQPLLLQHIAQALEGLLEPDKLSR